MVMKEILLLVMLLLVMKKVMLLVEVEALLVEVEMLGQLTSIATKCLRGLANNRGLGSKPAPRLFSCLFIGGTNNTPP